MDSLLQLLKEHRVGIWCRRGAWIILAIGLMRIALEIYNILFINNSALVINPLAASSFVTPEAVSIAAELTTLAEFLFYFFILYAIFFLPPASATLLLGTFGEEVEGAALMAKLNVTKFYQDLPGFHIFLLGVLSRIPTLDYYIVASGTLC
jgi:hypothetical protein